MNIRPLQDRILVKRVEEESKTKGGIIIPEKHKEREDAASERGIVVEVSPMAFVGSDWDLEAEKPKKGDTVLFQRYAGKEINIETGDIKYRVIADDDIKGIVL